MKNCFMWKHHGHTVPCHFGCTDVCQIGVSRANNRDSGPFLESFVSSLNPIAWYRYLVEIDTSGWGDQSGNGNDITFTNSPTVNADGVTFNGTDEYGRAAFTLAQPYAVYFLGRQITYTSGDRIIGGAINATPSDLLQQTATPNVRLLGSGAAAENTNWVLNTYAAIAYVMNGAASLLQVNNTSATTGNPGANSADGITLAASSNAVVSAFGNVNFKEVIVFPAAHDAGQRAKVIAYLAQVGNLTI